MKKAMKRMLGLVLCFVMIFAMIPATQAFAETTIYRHWDSASGTLSFNTTAAGGTAITALSTDTVIGSEASRSKVLHVVFFCDVPVSNAYMLFNGFSSLVDFEGISHMKLDGVTDMRGMFKNCSSLTAIDLSFFNTNAVTKMSEMFSGCKNLKSIDLSKFNTSKVTETYAMFRECSGLSKLNVGKFNTSLVTDMNGMFYGCSGLSSLDVSNFDTTHVKDMGSMFCGCSGLNTLNLSNFDTANVTHMWWMFSGCKNLTSVNMSGWNTSNVSYWNYMFNNCSSLKELDLSALSFSTCSVEMENMFQNCTGLRKLTVGPRFGYYTNPSREARFPVDMMALGNGYVMTAGSIIPQDVSAKRSYIAAVVVRFNANGGKGSMESQSFRYDEGSKALTANSFTKSGLDFVGWNTKADGTGTAYSDEQVLSYDKLGHSITLYAQWKTVKPKITVQPTNVTANPGDNATFSVTATGTGLKYQWQVRTKSSEAWDNVNPKIYSGGTSSKLTVPVTLARNGYQYRCVVSNAGGSTASNMAALSVSGAKPVIVKDPANTSLTPGNTAKFTVQASGTGLSYQWQVRTSSKDLWDDVNPSIYTGGNTDTLSVPAVSGRNGYQYRCVVKNAKGSATSAYATLTITAATWPTITKHPTDVSAKSGESVNFTVEASGTNLSYQWQVRTSSTDVWDNVNPSIYSGCNSTKLTVPATGARNGYEYRCVVSNGVGSVESKAAKLTVASSGQPVIKSQPLDAAGVPGTTAKFTVTASGSGLSYQWQVRTNSADLWDAVNPSIYTGGNTAALSVPVTAARNGYQYRCVVSNANGSVTSNYGTLTVGSAPSITAQPLNVTATAGTTAQVSVTASGSGLSYQWQVRTSSTDAWDNVNPSIYSGGTSATLSIPATLARNGYQFRCVVKNGYGSTASNACTLTVGAKPVITTQPVDTTATDGSTATMTLTASGSGLSYQWQVRTYGGEDWDNVNPSIYSGGTSATLSIPATLARNGYEFRCVVTNSYGSVYSATVTLYVS